VSATTRSSVCQAGDERRERRAGPSRPHLLAALAISLVALAVSPAGALAATNITNATIDGVANTSAPGGSVLGATVTANVTSGTWRATRVNGATIGTGNDNCSNHSDQSTGLNRNVSFNITAPGTPDNYNVGFTPNDANDCAGTDGSTFTLTNGLRVTPPATNEDLPPRCGINVMLVLDKSGSIASSGQTEAVKTATRSFLNALSGTGAKVSIVDFSSTAARPVPYTTVTADSIADTFEPYLRTGYNPSGFTNWEAAFHEVRNANTQGTVADLVVFMTDGDPTARNTATGVQTGLTDGAVAAMRPAQAEADLVKGQGSHVLMLGVGAAVTRPASAKRLTAMSGFDQFPPAPFAEADYTLVENFNDLAAALRQIATELCSGSVTVTKLVDTGDGTFRPQPGWDFTAAVDMSSGSFTWVQPPPATPPDTRTQTTTQDGVATFQWNPSSATATSTVTLTEIQKPGFVFVDADCSIELAGQRSRVVLQRVRSVNPSANLTIPPNAYAKCTVRNRISPGTIQIIKSANPQTSQAFTFTGSGPLGTFTLVDDGVDPSTTSRTFNDLTPGTYTVSEVLPENWGLTSITCSDPRVVITGTQVAITIGPNDAVVCLYQDTRNEPPPDPEPPEPPIPPTTPTTPPTTPTTPGTTPPGQGILGEIQSNATRLRVVKTAPAVARIGDTGRVTLTVTNVGPVAARNVQMMDIPPAAIGFVRLSTTVAPARRVRGNAVWRIGTLAPGQSRTVTVTVRLTRGDPGLWRNNVIATASNARAVTNHSDTRILGARRPRFTG
jgi:uncharacterized repeat protein (TIGR01451 family)